MLRQTGNRVLTTLLQPPGFRPVLWPEEKTFAFTVIDDTDQATLPAVQPIYELLHQLGLHTTKTVWVEPTVEPEENDSCGDTLADEPYRDFILRLQDRGFEIAFHGARGGSSKRLETKAALEQFQRILGHDPKVHVNHFQNRENLYGGRHKLDFRPLRWLYSLFLRWNFEGHNPQSPYFWGDLAKRHITYVRDFHFDEIDVMQIYPLLPFHDPRRPYVNFWFHASDGSNIDSFVRLLSRENLNRLEHNHGLCIVYTHFGKGFCTDGEVGGAVADRLRDVAGRDGWFAPVGEILDYLRRQNGDQTISYKNRVYMELRWALEKLGRGTT
ncbi:MAG: hypothetical protein ABII79_02255 [bacterium]